MNPNTHQNKTKEAAGTDQATDMPSVPLNKFRQFMDERSREVKKQRTIDEILNGVDTHQ